MKVIFRTVIFRCKDEDRHIKLGAYKAAIITLGDKSEVILFDTLRQAIRHAGNTHAIFVTYKGTGLENRDDRLYSVFGNLHGRQNKRLHRTLQCPQCAIIEDEQEFPEDTEEYWM